jgi:hypothetical protein
MTLLVSWLATDKNGTPTSAYIAADSRISWGSVGFFDHGRKVFAFKNSPDILGYCGDVLFPSIVLGQILEMGDRGLLFPPDATCKERFEAILAQLMHQFQHYPHTVEQITVDTLQILHISRDPHKNTQFACFLMEWRRTSGWKSEEIEPPQQVGVLKVLGSGEREFKENLIRYEKGLDQGTSRCVFHCFCDSLFNIKDYYCGGAPQLVGLYTNPKSSGITYGIIKNSQRYFLGALIDKTASYEGVEWRNEFFEICDGSTMKTKKGAQKQPDVMRRKRAAL